MIDPYLNAVHGRTVEAGQQFAIWSPKQKTQFFSDVEAGAAFCQEHPDRDLYTGLGTFITPPSTGRGKTGDITGLVGLWADIDIGSKGHKKQNLPPDVGAAFKILDAAGPKPTLVVASGGGLHAYWLFNELLVFEDDAGRQAAVHLAARWNATLMAAAQSMGYVVDPTKAITQVLRVAGTQNHKLDKPRPVTVETQGGPTYEPDDLEAFCIDVPAQSAPQVEVDHINIPTGDLPSIVDELLEDAEFKRTWNRKRTDLDDQSASSYDLSIASFMARRGATDQEIADAIAAWRKKHNMQPEKARRRDYVTRTIRKARSEQARDAAISEINILTETTDKAVGAATYRQLLSSALEVTVHRFIQWQGNESTFVLEVGDPPKQLILGPATTIFSPARVREKFLEAGIPIPRILWASTQGGRGKKSKWPSLVTALQAIMETEQAEDDVLAARLEAGLRSYLHTSLYGATYSKEEIVEAVSTNRPLVYKGSVAINIARFRKFLHDEFDYKISPQALHATLKEMGWTPHRLHVAAGVAGRYMMLPMDDASQFSVTLDDQKGVAR